MTLVKTVVFLRFLLTKKFSHGVSLWFWSMALGGGMYGMVAPADLTSMIMMMSMKRYLINSKR